MKIMIVDDDVDILQLLEEILKLKFPTIHVEVAKNGVEALNLIKENVGALPDVILSDMKMPVMGGNELCKLVREHYPAIKMALMTAFKETSDCFAEVFFKPINFERLFSFLRSNWVE